MDHSIDGGQNDFLGNTFASSGGPTAFPNTFGTFASFGQLLRDADAGALYNQLSIPWGNEEDYIDELQGYEAEEESSGQSDADASEDDMDASEDQHNENASENQCSVQFVDDTIAEEEFQGRPCVDSDYDQGNKAVDDTVFLNETEREDNGVEASVAEGITVLDDLVNEIGPEEENECLLGDCGLAEHQLTHEISTEYLDSLKAGYKRRNRGKKETNGPDCRKPRDMGAIEVAMRLAKSRKTEYIFEPLLGMVFDSPEEAYEFYNMYSWECGFGIVKNRCRRRQSDQNFRSMQELCCERSGIDRRVNASTKKILCKARIKILHGTDGGWYISEFQKEHNHPFAESCSEKREWFSHKRLDPHTLGIIRYLRDANVNQTQVRCIVGAMFGSLKGAPCTKRTIRTICNQIARERMDHDVSKTMELFRQMKSNDPEFQWSVETVKDSRINTLMWCTGKSREQYACFGDVVTFDTTYCTNFYKMPFGLFVGVNNHFQTVVFGGVLMRSETTESFEWVFKEFVNLMGGLPPKTVLTDQCKAMTIALGNVWPDTFHLWCRWHVLKNIRESLGPTYTKNATFRAEFYAMINEMLTKEEFENSWDDLCSRYKLEENPFMIRTYQCRSKWAKPWAKGNFCAGMTSTQRSESANWMLKRFVPRNSSMHKFVSQFNLLLEDRDMEEGREENLTKQLYVKYSRLWPVERHAVQVYTRQSFKLFKKQIDLAANFKVTTIGPDFYIVERNRKEIYPEWRKLSYKIQVYEDNKRYYCECGFFEHIGILCCHTLRVMIRMEIEQIPDVHILTRWTKNAKDVIPEHMKFNETDIDVTGSINIWQRRMNTRAMEACTKANSYRETYDILMRHLGATIKQIDQFIEDKKNSDEIQGTPVDEIEILTDGENARRNRYGASGSSAGLSDAEIKNLRGPEVAKQNGRPRTKRLLSSSEKGIKSKSKKPCVRGKAATKTVSDKNKQNKTVTKTPKSSKAKQTPKLAVDPENRGLPFQTTFCTKCKKPGHNRSKCGLQAHSASTKNTNVRCDKCGLKGHKESECLVVDEDSDRYFR